MSSKRSRALFALILAAAAIVPSSLRAQQTTAVDRGNPTAEALPSPAPVPSVVLRGPQLVSAQSVRLAPAGPIEVNAPQDRVRAGHDVAMMAVGGAGVVVGLMIGGDSGVIIASVSGVIGLIGLWRYLQ